MASSALVLLEDSYSGDEPFQLNTQGPALSESNLNDLYQLEVYTAVSPGCGTPSEVQVKLEGSVSTTDWLSLTNSHPSEAEKVTFPNGSKRQYMIASRCGIGIPERVHFKLLTCPSDSNKYDWTVDHVILRELSSQSQWMVRVNQTLYADTCDDSEYSFDDVVTGLQNTASSAFRVNLARGFLRIHLWALWNKTETNLGVFTTLTLLINIILGILTVNSITILLKAYAQDASQIYISATQIRYLALGYCGTVFGIWSLEWLLRFLQPKDVVSHIEFKTWLSSTDYQKKYPLQSFKYYTCQSDYLEDWQTIQPHRYPSYNKLGTNTLLERTRSLNKVATDNGTLGCARKSSVLQTAFHSIHASCKDEEILLTCIQPAEKTRSSELVKPSKDEVLLLTCTQPAQKTRCFELVKPGEDEDLLLTCTQPTQKTRGSKLVKPDKDEEMLLTCTQPTQKTRGLELVKPDKDEEMLLTCTQPAQKTRSSKLVKPDKDEEMLLICTQPTQKTRGLELVKPGKAEELLLTCTQPAQKTRGCELVKPEMFSSTNVLNPQVTGLRKMCTTVMSKALQLIQSSTKISTSVKPTTTKIDWSSIKHDMEEIREVAVELQATVKENVVYHSYRRLGNKNAHNNNNKRGGAARKNKCDAATQTEEDEWSFITDSSDAETDSHGLENVHWKESQQLQLTNSLANKVTTPAKNECAIYVGTTKKSPQDSAKSTVRKYVINKNAIDNALVNSNSINESPSSHCTINIENDDNGDMIGATQESDTGITVSECDQPEPCVHDGPMASQTKISPLIAGLPDNHSNFTSITSINMEKAPEVCFSTNSLRADEEKPATDSFTLISNKPGKAIETMVFFLEGTWSRYLNDKTMKNTSMASRSVLLLLLLVAGVLSGFCVAKFTDVGWAVYYKVVIYWAIAIFGDILLLEPIKSLLSVAYTTYIAKELVRW